MPKISALLHTHNDARRLGRALESLRPCDEVIIIDDCSEDDTVKVARDHGATVRNAIPGVTPGTYVIDASHEWILCLRPNESLSDDLETALLEWKDQQPDECVKCYKIPVREENGEGWQERPPEVRLLNRKMINWIDELPGNQICDTTLSGHLLSFHQP
ncbi:MAG: glycosyltransferase [Candidatus Korobacteraceae bacterium]